MRAVGRKGLGRVAVKARKARMGALAKAKEKVVAKRRAAAKERARAVTRKAKLEKRGTTIGRGPLSVRQASPKLRKGEVGVIGLVLVVLEANQ